MEIDFYGGGLYERQRETKWGHAHYIEISDNDNPKHIYFESNEFNIGDPDSSDRRKLMRSGTISTNFN